MRNDFPTSAMDKCRDSLRAQLELIDKLEANAFDRDANARALTYEMTVLARTLAEEVDITYRDESAHNIWLDDFARENCIHEYKSPGKPTSHVICLADKQQVADAEHASYYEIPVKLDEQCNTWVYTDQGKITKVGE